MPPEDPDGVRPRSCGFRVWPPSELSAAPDANSDMLTLARMIAPASRSFFTTNASSGGIEPSSSTEPPVVGMSKVSKLSFSTIGMPCSAERGPLALRSASSARAVSSALGFRVSTACSDGPLRSNASMRARQSCTSFSEVSVPAVIAALRSAMVAWSYSTALAAEPCVIVRERSAAASVKARRNVVIARHVNRPAAGCVALRADGRHATPAWRCIVLDVSVTIFKIVPASLWAAAEAAGQFAGSPVDVADGFIHFSTAAQAPETAARHFAGQAGLLLAAIDADALGTGPAMGAVPWR